MLLFSATSVCANRSHRSPLPSPVLITTRADGGRPSASHSRLSQDSDSSRSGASFGAAKGKEIVVKNR